MCGIVGYIGTKNSATDFVIGGLRALEYRGYDSAGIAAADQGKLIYLKNTGRVTLRNVVLRDRLPRGLSFVSASRTNTLASGNATFQIGSLAPGASRTVVVTLMANASVRGSRTNVATVSATNVRPKSAQAATVFRALVRRVQPAVTG